MSLFIFLYSFHTAQKVESRKKIKENLPVQHMRERREREKVGRTKVYIDFWLTASYHQPYTDIQIIIDSETPLLT